MTRSSRSRSAWRYWAGFFWLPVLAVVIALCFDVTFMSRGDGRSYEEYEPGAVVSTVPAAGASAPVFERLVALALSRDQQSFWALDGWAGKLYRFDLDGELLAEMGRHGEGPGEMTLPSALQPAPEGVWVLDPQGGRATLWGADGEVARTLNLGGVVAGTFVPAASGLVMPVAGAPTSAQPVEPFAYVSDEGATPLRTDQTARRALRVLDDVAERLYGLRMAAVGENQAVLVRNGAELAAWRAVLDDDAQRIRELSSLTIPQPALDAIGRLEDPASDMKVRPVSSVRLVGDDLWVMTNGVGPELLGFTVPRSRDDAVVLAYPGELYKKGLIDSIVLPDRIIAASATEIVVARRVAVPPEPPSPRPAAAPEPC